MNELHGKIPIGTTALLEAELTAANKKRALIKSVILEIEAIFLREDMDMGDLMEVFGVFTERANKVFSKIKIKKIKDDYNYDRII